MPADTPVTRMRFPCKLVPDRASSVVEVAPHTCVIPILEACFELLAEGAFTVEKDLAAYSNTIGAPLEFFDLNGIFDYRCGDRRSIRFRPRRLNSACELKYLCNQEPELSLTSELCFTFNTQKQAVVTF
jgi:hypothetical protein